MVLALGLVVCPAELARAVSMDKVITYQGRLIDANNQADDLYDFQFKLFDDPNVTFGNGGVGRTLYVIGVDVIDGYFKAPLYFGDDPNIFNGDPRWLEIAVRPHDDSPLPPGKGEPVPGADIYIEQDEDSYDAWDLIVTYLPKSVAEGSSEYTILSPRQPITPTPYAIYAQTAGGGLCSCDCDGTPNYIAKFTDTNDLGDSVIYEDSVTRNIGIDASDPQEKLDVDGNVIVRGKALKVIGGPDSYIQVGTPQLGYGTTFSYESDPTSGMFDTYIKNPCGKGVGCDLIIDFPFGNVGIGTNNPKTKLEINGSMKAAVSSPGHNAVSAFFTNPADAVDSAVSIDLGIGTAAPSEWRIKATHNSLEMGNAVVVPPAITIGNSHHVAINNGLSVGGGGDVAIHAASGTIPLILITGKHGVVTFGEQFGIYAWGGQKAGWFSGDVYVSEKIGIGTTDPQRQLHVVGLARFDLGGGRIEMSTPGGWPGVISYSPAGHRRDIIVDELGLRVLTSATSAAPSAENGITIREDGSVGIGTSYPGTYKLAVNGSAAKPGGGSWSSFSDMRLKNLNGGYERGLSEISRLNPVRYEYKENNERQLPAGREFVGLVAQEVEGIIPEAVERTGDGYLMVNNDPIVWAMVNAIKELKDENRELRAQNEQIRERLEVLEKSMQQNQFRVVKEVQQ